jgi:hypothetical protein
MGTLADKMSGGKDKISASREAGIPVIDSNAYF